MSTDDIRSEKQRDTTALTNASKCVITEEHDCIFCKIVARKAPANVVFENEHVLAFLDLQPLTKGHTLVIPKTHYKNLTVTPPEEMARLASVLPKIANAVTQAVGTSDYNIMQNNGAAALQVVFHLHFHIIPRFVDQPIGGKGFRIQRKRADPEEAKMIKNLILAKM
ncbi:hypothetical protein BZG36_02319 [Bifiguratus adelaidae]|uniref:HIT domain-containing protein n=1 Tax=Bifiguratus adelaidae TaxID=1938954 RepID=A0A261Y3M6_9FUNG|nr:hypothetical protein BZG36_02319 [Bifiguratus adelaidae]